jgi:hypothetical protein
VNVRFCPSCRSLILADFRFCPYCGAVAAKGPGLEEALSGPFEKMSGSALSEPAPEDGNQAGAKPSVFASAEASLDRLEAEMDLILEELEKEGRPPK